MDQPRMGWRYGVGVATAAVCAAAAMGATWGDEPAVGSPPDPAAARAFAAASTTAPAADEACGARKQARSVTDVIDPKQWYLTLPTGKAGKPDTVEGAELPTLANPAFRFDERRGGVQFRATAGGVTTKNSDYPRSELREEDGGEHAAWSNTAGTHTLEVCQAVTELPKAKPHVVTAQIHDAKSDVMEVRLEGATLIAQYGDGKKEFVLDPAYQLGTPYDVRIQAADGRINVSYNGKEMGTIDQKGSGWYFKTGSYVQSNTEKGDKADAAGTVLLYSAKVQHDGAAVDKTGAAAGGHDEAQPTASAMPSGRYDEPRPTASAPPSRRNDEAQPTASAMPSRRNQDSSMRESSNLPTKEKSAGY